MPFGIVARAHHASCGRDTGRRVSRNPWATKACDVIAAGIDPTGIPEMFQILLDERKAKPDALETWFRSHPLEESRIAASRARIAAYLVRPDFGATELDDLRNIA